MSLSFINRTYFANRIRTRLETSVLHFGNSQHVGTEGKVYKLGKPKVCNFFETIKIFAPSKFTPKDFQNK